MEQFVFKKINAFSSGASSGNPAACVYLKDKNDISDDQMQLIARELKGFVNEVVYLFPEGNHYLLKYYSSECEVDFCGHGTIAAMYDYIKNNVNLIDKEMIQIKVKNDILDIYNKITQEDSVFITAPYQNVLKTSIKEKEITGALSLNADDLSREHDIALINAGLNTLIVPVKDLDTCLMIYPEESVLKAFSLSKQIDIILVFSNEVSNSVNDFRTRVFAPKFGYLEDPATGSGNSAFGYYLMNRNIWDGQSLTIEQNNSRDIPNIVKLSKTKKGDKQFVTFGGSAIVKIEGIYHIS